MACAVRALLESVEFYPLFSVLNWLYLVKILIAFSHVPFLVLAPRFLYPPVYAVRYAVSRSWGALVSVGCLFETDNLKLLSL